MTFRALIPAIILISLFASLACGQGVPITCLVGTGVPPEVRWEGYTGLAGDIYMNCTGGTALVAASGSAAATASSPNAIPQMTVVANLGTTVTSRILGSGGLSEALLLVDEPGAVGLNTYGSTLPISVCPTPLATAWQSAASPGCQEWVGNIGSNTNVPVLSTGGQTNTTPGYNAFPGIVNGSQVTFNGVPMLPPGGGGNSRVFRITNIRVNANAVTLGTVAFQLGSVTAQLSVGGVQLNLSDPSVTAAYVTPTLTGSLGNPSDGAALTTPVFTSSSGVGSPGTPSVLGYLRFTEGVAYSFRTRVAPLVTGAGGSGQSATAEQDIPGAIYNSESGFTPYVGTTPQYFGGNTTYIPGLADSGTRVKAVFHNIPRGVTIYVGTTSGGNSTIGLVGTLSARMVASPIAPESASPVTPTVTIGGAGFVPLVPSNGSGTATWEVVTDLLYSVPVPENFDIPVAVYAAPGVASAGTVTVNLSYAPTQSDAQGPQFIPTFFDTSTPMPLFTISGAPATPVPSSLILILCGLGALLLFAAGRKLAAR